MADYLNEKVGKIEAIPSTDLMTFQRQLTKFKKLQEKTVGASYTLPFVDIERLQAELNFRLKNKGEALSIEASDQLLITSRKEANIERAKRMKRDKELRQRIGGPDKPQELSLGTPERTTSPTQQTKGTPATAADIRAQREALRRQKNLDKLHRQRGKDPDDPSMGTITEIPSVDMSSGNLEPDPYADPKGVKQRTDPNDPRTGTYTPLNLRGGGLQETETGGPNRGVSITQILSTKQSIKQQLEYVFFEEREDEHLMHRNIKFLLQKYAELGGDKNKLIQDAQNEFKRREEENRRRIERGDTGEDFTAGGTAEDTAVIARNKAQRRREFMKWRQEQKDKRGGKTTAPAQTAALYRQMTEMARGGRGRSAVQTIPIPIPMPMPQRADRKGTRGIVVKQTVKQQQRTTARTNDRIRKRAKGSITRVRKQYTKLKQQIKAALQKAKKSEYAQKNEKIKTLPVKSRKGARAKLRAEIKTKLTKLLNVAKPGTAYRTIVELNRAIALLKKLKW
jgi:hypothetical protein